MANKGTRKVVFSDRLNAAPVHPVSVPVGTDAHGYRAV